MRKRSQHVSVWLTDKELAHLKEQARQAGMGIDPFIRSLIEGVGLRPRPPETCAALLQELSAIGNNINQSAHCANARKAVTNAEIKEAVELVRQTWQLVKETL